MFGSQICLWPKECWSSCQSGSKAIKRTRHTKPWKRDHRWIAEERSTEQTDLHVLIGATPAKMNSLIWAASLTVVLNQCAVIDQAIAAVISLKNFGRNLSAFMFASSNKNRRACRITKNSMFSIRLTRSTHFNAASFHLGSAPILDRGFYEIRSNCQMHKTCNAEASCQRKCSWRC